MRRTLIIVLGTAVALATAAVAIAVVPAVNGISSTAATFAAGTPTDLKTRTCVGIAPAHSYAVTKAHYTGTVTGDAVLAGALTIHARTTSDTTSGLGYVEGSFRIKDGDSRVKGKFWGTLQGTALVGFLEGKARGNHARVLGNMSATFVPATGFTSGVIGTRSATSQLAVIAGPICKDAKGAEKPTDAKNLKLKGTVTALTPASAPSAPGSITITPKGGGASQSCTIPVGFTVPAGITVTPVTNVDAECSAPTGIPPVSTLLKLKKHD